jgi:hypothetical protein
MKLFGRLLVLALLALGVWWVTAPVTQLDLLALFGRDREAWKLELVPQSGISVTYVADKRRWLSFPVAPGANRIRILSNANLYHLDEARRAREADPRRRWHYALEIEVLDARGDVLLHRVHHHRTDLGELVLPDGRRVPAAFYLNEPLAPISGVPIVLNLAGMPQADRLRIRTAEADPEVADVVVRAYYPEATRADRALLTWQRLSDRQKNALARGSVFAHELLTEDERRNLILNQWQPAGPQGARGEDFTARELYVLRDIEAEPADDPIPPAGLVAGPDQVAVIHVPEGGATLRLQATPLNPPAPGTALQLHAGWYGSGPQARTQIALPLREADGRLVAEHHFEGGQIDIDAPLPMAVRAFIADGVPAQEITPERLYHRLYLARADSPVDYLIAHDGERATPIRIEARHFIDPAAQRPPPALRYEFLAADDAPLASGELALPAAASRYDQAVGSLPGLRISDPLETWFAVPPAARRLRLSAAGATPVPVLVAVSSRPATLPREIRAPEDRYAFTAREQRVPAWFGVRPADYPKLIADNRSQLVAVQSRPPEDAPALLAGEYDREDFRPTGRWLVRQLLTPREATAPLRDKALASTYTPLPAGRGVRLAFPAWMGLRQLSPTLLWVAPDDTPFDATLYVDGRPHHRFGGHTRYGELRLPPLSAGPHTLELEVRGGNPAARHFINLARPPGESYVLRRASRIGHELEYVVDRHGTQEETLTARLFQPAGWNGRATLSAKLNGPAPVPLTPLSGWHFDERRFDVRPDASWAAPIFDTRGERSDAGQPLFIHFPAGTPAGRYLLRFRLADAPAGYLTVSRITPGQPVRRRVFEEAEGMHVEGE